MITCPMDPYSAAFRRAARTAAGCGNRRPPVDLVDGDSAPELVGESGHWTTKAGRPVYSPSAYIRAYGRPVYHRSTRRVVVGREWRP